MLPATVGERHGQLLVVRDDRLPGGTKRRAMLRVLPTMGAAEFVYASPAYGYAQMALAYACRDLGLRATVFVAKRSAPHARTMEAHRAGAKVVQVPYGYLSNVQAKARAYASQVGAALVPFGLDDPRLIAALAEEAKGTGLDPAEAWCAAGSGVLARSLQAAWPGARAIAVRVGAEPSLGRARRIDAPEKYEQPAKRPPPFPSCPEYGAKVWQFAQREACDGAVFWNVGG